MASDVVTLDDGRRAQLWVGGADHGPLVLVLHGCPDTRHVAMTGARAALEVGVRLLCVNRPGYGASDPHDTTPGSVADDAVAVTRSLGHERFAVLGMSVGGLYAVAAAARHPERVAALGLVAPQRPAPEAGTVAEKVERYRPSFLEHVAALDPTDPDDDALAQRFLDSVPPPDAALLAAGGSAAVAASTREPLAQPEGYLRDAAHLFSPWPHGPDKVRCPAHVWCGELDDRAEPGVLDGHPRPDDVRVVVRPGTTHLATLLDHWPEVLSTLRAHLGD